MLLKFLIFHKSIQKHKKEKILLKKTTYFIKKIYESKENGNFYSALFIMLLFYDDVF